MTHKQINLLEDGIAVEVQRAHTVHFYRSCSCDSSIAILMGVVVHYVNANDLMDSYLDSASVMTVTHLFFQTSVVIIYLYFLYIGFFSIKNSGAYILLYV